MNNDNVQVLTCVNKLFVLLFTIEEEYNKKLKINKQAQVTMIQHVPKSIIMNLTLCCHRPLLN